MKLSLLKPSYVGNHVCFQGFNILLFNEQHFNLKAAKHDYSRFYSVLLADQITIICYKMSVYTSRYANVLSRIKQMSYFHPLKVVVCGN